MNIEDLKEVLANKDVHYTIKCEAMAIYKARTDLSERVIARLTGIPKSSVHRMLIVYSVDADLEAAAVANNVDFYALVVYCECKDAKVKDKIRGMILSGQITKHKQAKAIAAKANVGFQKKKLMQRKSYLEKQLRITELQLESA